MSSREDDFALLHKALALDLVDGEEGSGFEGERGPFEEMLELMKAGERSGLSDRQRKWVKSVVDKHEPEYENLVSSGKVPRGREVVVNVGPLPKRPPHRRSE